MVGDDLEIWALTNPATQTLKQMNFQGCSLRLNSQEKEKEGTSKDRSAAAQAHSLLYGFCERFNFPLQKEKESRSGLLFGSCRSYKDFPSKL